MRRSMIAVLLVSWWPGLAWACIEHDPLSSGWVDGQSQRSWEMAEGRQAQSYEQPIRLILIAAVIILSTGLSVGISKRRMRTVQPASANLSPALPTFLVREFPNDRPVSEPELDGIIYPDSDEDMPTCFASLEVSSSC
jgi:hypothetical protein